ncbi:hypothetical protein H4696_003458 [Amycolatopsis lexingtonensis]|uniref:Protein kinase domain-containing protein n=1 Tax=Amycolatopsis lexingtonensis TaxID=218822 RepID=A0ABR9HZL9_9PSEU|nr:protein kinase family protein [Amycolatopsis lexingtonensis]MBE1496358.1 hypothetical protein [Amycolatopsis lexingtonensis]
MLVTDTCLADGRYRLLNPCGATRNGGAEFWLAHDEANARDVALTVLTADPGGRHLFDGGARVLEHARLTATAGEPAVAPVLDVFGPAEETELGAGAAGLVVATWTPGAEVLDTVRQAPVPAERACRMLRPLAAAADRLHHRGLLAGIDCPQRIRIGADGTLVLAFPGPAPTATQREDVYGLGALLYALIVGEWPAPDAAEWLPDAVPERLRLVVQLSLGCAGLGEIHTATPLLEAMARFETDAVIPEPSVARPVPEPAAEPPSRPVRLRPMDARSALTAILAIAVVVLVAGGVTQVSGLFDRTPAAVPLSLPSPAPAAVLPRPAPVSPVPSSTPPAAPVAVRPDRVAVFSVTGSPDHSREAGLAADGDPATAWPTDQYREQFPQFAPGVGLLAGFGRPLRVRGVDVTSPSAGSVVEIRVAATAQPTLAETVPVATATLAPGTTMIPVPSGAASAVVLVWLVRLAPGPGGYQSTIQEIAYLGDTG